MLPAWASLGHVFCTGPHVHRLRGANRRLRPGCRNRQSVHSLGGLRVGRLSGWSRERLRRGSSRGRGLLVPMSVFVGPPPPPPVGSFPRRVGGGRRWGDRGLLGWRRRGDGGGGGVLAKQRASRAFPDALQGSRAVLASGRGAERRGGVHTLTPPAGGPSGARGVPVHRRVCPLAHQRVPHGALSPRGLAWGAERGLLHFFLSLTSSRRDVWVP